MKAYILGALAACTLVMNTGAAHAELIQEKNACASQDLTWCKPHAIGQLATDQDATMAQVAKDVLIHFGYRRGEEESPDQDKWTSHLDAAEAGKSWVGDCDNLTMTTIEMAVKHGVNPARLYRALVATESAADKGVRHTGPIMGHMVAVYEATDGKFYVIGDTDNLRQPMAPLGLQDNHIVYVSNVLLGKKWFKASSLGTIVGTNELDAVEKNIIKVVDTTK